MLSPDRHRFDFCRPNREKGQGFAQAVFQSGVQGGLPRQDMRMKRRTPCFEVFRRRQIARQKRQGLPVLLKKMPGAP